MKKEEKMHHPSFTGMLMILKLSKTSGWDSLLGTVQYPQSLNPVSSTWVTLEIFSVQFC